MYSQVRSTDARTTSTGRHSEESRSRWMVDGTESHRGDAGEGREYIQQSN